MTEHLTRAQELAAKYAFAATGDDFTEADWDNLDRLEPILAETGDLTPSTAGQKLNVGSRQALRYLQYLVANQYAHTSGNGSWTHYHPGRAQ